MIRAALAGLFAAILWIGGAQAQVTGVLQNAATSSTNGTPLAVSGMATAVLTVNCAACSGGTTVGFQATADGTNYTSILGTLAGTLSSAVSTTTAGLTVWTLPIAGYVSIRAPVSGYSAGTVTVTVVATSLSARSGGSGGESIVPYTSTGSTVTLGLASGGCLTELINQTTPGVLTINLPSVGIGNGLCECVKDGTNGFSVNTATVKTTDGSTIDYSPGASGYPMNQNGQYNCFKYDGVSNWLVT
jgi:hypothetical protein